MRKVPDKDFKKCRCGMWLSPAQLSRHKEGIWHGKASHAKELRGRGLSFAEIARQLGVTRAYISQRFRLVEEGA
jgi:hypothetical protein